MSIDHVDPDAAAARLVAQNEKRVEDGLEQVDLQDPEEVTDALQNMYDLSYDDADQLGMVVFDILCTLSPGQM